MANPNEFYIKLVKEIFRYIKSSLSKNLFYRKRQQNEILTFTIIGKSVKVLDKVGARSSSDHTPQKSKQL
jgi:hypothetical protein